MTSSLLRNEPKICVSVAPRSPAEASVLLEQADVSAADYVELRLDGMFGGVEGLGQLLKRLTKPLVLTYSTDPSIGLGATIGPKQLEPLVGHAEYVDMEHAFPNTKRIRSIHLARSIGLEEGLRLASQAWQEGCDLVKIVFRAQKYADNVTALRLTSTLRVPNIVFCMGELGAVSRVLAPLCGSKWTYASLRPGLETAPGQIDVDTLRQIYGLMGGQL